MEMDSKVFVHFRFIWRW